MVNAPGARYWRAPPGLLAQHFKAWRFAELNAGFERVDGEANRSKSAAKIPSKIKKTQMQSRRRRDLNAFQRAPLLLDSFAAYGLDEFAATLRNFARFAKRRTRRIMRRGLAVILRPSWLGYSQAPSGLHVAVARSKCQSRAMGAR
jgi:hypothetical protein